MNKHLTTCLMGLILLVSEVSFGARAATMGDMVAVLDIGQYIRIRNTGPIELAADERSADPFTNFKGCREVVVDCNFRAQLAVSAKAVSAALGTWKATITPGFLEPGSSKVMVCVAGANVLTHLLMGGQEDVPVAEITIQVIAR